LKSRGVERTTLCGVALLKGGIQEGCRVPWGKDGEENWRESFNIHSRKLASRPVFLLIPKGGNAYCMSPLNEMATMPPSVLFLLSQQRIIRAIHTLAHERGIMLDSVLERLAAPDSASIQIRTRLSARSHISTTARNLIDPILDVQTDWRWQKLKITLNTTGSITTTPTRSVRLILVSEK